ncbi:MAG: Ig-like domain-containing protein [Opitutales bacterium]|nr:Ig-like domain-containing protein [Opitutales bacterium]MCH8540018.1 Ig-like domain-containing protein [Opitutales bacterium]
MPIKSFLAQSVGSVACLAIALSTVAVQADPGPLDPTPGYDIYFNASSENNSSEEWENLASENVGLELDKSTNSEVEHLSISSAETDTEISAAFKFPGGFTGNEGGAELVESGTSNRLSFQDEGWQNQPVTFEIWFKPHDLYPGPENGQILFETGGGTGMGFFINNNELQFRKKPGSGGVVTYNLAEDPLDLLLGPATEEFMQAVFTFNNSTGDMQLFINGVLASSGTGGSGSWSGGDNAAFGTRGGTGVGSFGGGDSQPESFAGEIAVIRAYKDRILNPDEVAVNFKTFVIDETPPEITSFNPANNDTGIYPGIDPLEATFTESIELTGEGSVTLKNLNDTSGSSDVTFDLPDAAVTTDGNQSLLISPPQNLPFEANIAVLISDDAVRDLPGNLFAGISDESIWNFTTAEENTSPPVITAQTPETGQTGVGIGTTITATFDQNILAGSGDIVLKNLNEETSSLNIPITDTDQISIDENVLSITPETLPEGGDSYAILIPETALRNFSDVAFAGITSDEEWTFSTSNLAGQLGVLDMQANGNINPDTEQPWQVGDRYRLVFISSERVDPTDSNTYGDLDDINTWNGMIQNFADNATGHDLTSVTWSIIGSTVEVDARDNTATNPQVHGDGHPIMLIDGASILAGDYHELWGGPDNGLRNSINFTENQGETIDEASGGTTPYTGTTTEGTAVESFLVLRDVSESELERIQQGKSDSPLGWVDASNDGSQLASQGENSIYGMSEPLFVYDLEDDTPPELIAFTDNVEGGPIPYPDVDTVVYTVTFNEPMLPNSLAAGDFSNAGSAGISMDSIIQQDDPSVFLITVTLTSAGTLQLQINAEAEMTDLAGNPLDTTEAILDDSVIQVVDEDATAFEQWTLNFSGFTDPDPSLDFDGGGLATALEWALGGDPTDPSDDTSIRPTIDNTSDPDGKLLFTYRRSIEAHEDPGTTIQVEYGSDLVGWTVATHEGDLPEDITTSVETDGFGEGIDKVTVAFPADLAEDDRLFVRLNVEVENEPSD